MKTYLSIFFILSSFLLGGCSFDTYESPYYVKLAHKITARTANKIERATKLKLIGTGGGMMDDIQAMHMSFQLRHEITLEEGRELLLFVVNTYLSEINNDPKVQPYLHDVPFTAKNLEIRIWVYQPDRYPVAPGKICYVSARKGILRYYHEGPDRTTPIFQETLQEAIYRSSKTTP